LCLGLERLGYQAVGVTDPTEALAAFEETPTAFDAVVTDQVMPRMRGLELTRRFKAIRPEVKILLCTGYSDNVDEAAASAAGADAFLLKPADAVVIAPCLRRLFDGV